MRLSRAQCVERPGARIGADASRGRAAKQGPSQRMKRGGGKVTRLCSAVNSAEGHAGDRDIKFPTVFVGIWFQIRTPTRMSVITMSVPLTFKLYSDFHATEGPFKSKRALSPVSVLGKEGAYKDKCVSEFLQLTRQLDSIGSSLTDKDIRRRWYDRSLQISTLRHDDERRLDEIR